MPDQALASWTMLRLWTPIIKADVFVWSCSGTVVLMYYSGAAASVVVDRVCFDVYDVLYNGIVQFATGLHASELLQPAQFGLIPHD